MGGSAITPYAKRLVNKVLETGRISYGPFLRKFEDRFAELHNRKFAISAISGTSALQVALHAMKDKYGWKEDDEVIVPATTFIASANVVVQNRLRPIFVDVDPVYFHIDPKKIAEKITLRTRAIMPVHLCGLSCDMAPILKIARKHRLKIIEDSCEAVGVRSRGRPVGSRGDVACFSTYMAHLVTTGVGGLMLTNDPDLAVRMRSLVNHGRDSIYTSIDDDKGLRGTARFAVANRRFSFVTIGYSYRMTEFEGALGLAQLRDLSKNIQRRQRNAGYLLQKLEPLSEFLQLPRVPEYAEHAFMFFPIVVRSSRASRDVLVAWLEDHNIETRYLLPLISQPVYRREFRHAAREYPIAAHLDKNAFYIGCHPEMSYDELNYIVAVFYEFFTRNTNYVRP